MIYSLSTYRIARRVQGCTGVKSALETVKYYSNIHNYYYFINLMEINNFLVVLLTLSLNLAYNGVGFSRLNKI